MRNIIELCRQGGAISDQEAKLLSERLEGQNSGTCYSLKQTWGNQNMANIETVSLALERIKPRLRKRYEPIRKSRSDYLDPMVEFKNIWNSHMARGV